MDDPDSPGEKRFSAFKAAWLRGDALSMARLTREEWVACNRVWATSPLRFILFGFVVALVLRVFREIVDGPLVIDLVGLVAFLWYSGRTILALLVNRK